MIIGRDTIIKEMLDFYLARLEMITFNKLIKS